MLDIFASLLKAGLELVFCVTILRMFLLKQNRRNLLPFLMIGAFSGGIASLVLFVINKYWIRMEYGDVVVSGLLVAAIILLLVWTFVTTKFGKDYGGVLVILTTGFSLTLDKLDPILIFLYPVFSMQNGFNSEWIIHVGTAIASLLALLWLAYGFQRVVDRMGRVLIFAGLYVSFALVLGNQIVDFLQLLFGLQIIPLKMWMFDLLIPLINHKVLFFYGVMAAICILLITFFLQLRWFTPIHQDNWENPAAIRKHTAYEKSIRRWLLSVASCFIVISGSIVTQEVHAMKGIEEKEAVAVTPEAGHIHIDKSQIKEKELHVYSCSMEDGTEVRFIAVRKMGENFGIALDACEICGVAGYYEKDGQIICKKCGSVVNATTVGFKGGCNPIPIQYEQKDNGTIDISVSELEKYKIKFK